MTGLQQTPLVPQLVASAMQRFDSEPCLLLDDRIATYRKVRDLASRLL